MSPSTESTLRCFFAVELPRAVRANISEAVAALEAEVEAPVRWTRDEALHLTLKFAGDVPSDGIPKLISGAASRLARLEPFEVGFAGVGAFPNARAATVLWFGVAQGTSALARTARKLEAAAARAGVPRERRPFRAHLTVGRLREPAPLAIERLAGPTADAFEVSEITLFESRLSSAGSTYIPLARLPLGQAHALDIDFAPDL